jgi:hypothetical protein
MFIEVFPYVSALTPNATPTVIVVPAKAGTHDRPEQVHDPVFAFGLAVDPGLRRDDE